VSYNAKWKWTTGLWVVACSCVLPAKSKAYLRSILGSDGSEGQNLSMRGRPPKTDLLFMSSQYIRAPLHPTVQHYEPTKHQDLVKYVGKRMMLGHKIPRLAAIGVHTDNGNAASATLLVAHEPMPPHGVGP